MSQFGIKGAIQWDFDDLILASPIIQKFWWQTFFFFLATKKARILHKKRL